uniref:WW domain-containing protein n=1 Tax=Chrysotila carterae TaxID=13221 RepID=A0A7S4C0A3_CHRCT
MTEYWVSQARHWCEYCKIYISGSKPSIAFHENGRKHKEAVDFFLKEMRKRGRERRQDQQELDKELSKIERQAMKQFLRDDAGANAAHATKGLPAKAPADPPDRAARLAQLEATINAAKLLKSAPQLPSGWRACTNPDGKVYYTNDASGEMSWELPTAAKHGGPGPSTACASAGESASAASLRGTSPAAPVHGAAGGDGAAQQAVQADHSGREMAGRQSAGATTSALKQEASREGSAPRAQADGKEPAAPHADGFDGWQYGHAPDGTIYYYNTEKGVTQWEPPAHWMASSVDKAEDAAGTNAAVAAAGAACGAADAGAAAGAVAAAGAPVDGTELRTSAEPEASCTAEVKVETSLSGRSDVDNDDAAAAPASGEDAGVKQETENVTEKAESVKEEAESVKKEADGVREEAGESTADTVADSTGMGGWTVVEPAQPAASHSRSSDSSYRQRYKKPKFARGDSDEEEAQELIRTLQTHYPVPEDVRAAMEAARKAEEAAAAAAPPPSVQFNKRKTKACFRKK